MSANHDRLNKVKKVLDEKLKTMFIMSIPLMDITNNTNPPVYTSLSRNDFNVDNFETGPPPNGDDISLKIKTGDNFAIFVPRG